MVSSIKAINERNIIVTRLNKTNVLIPSNIGLSEFIAPL